MAKSIEKATTPRLEPRPVSKAKTAYALLSEVRRVILDEPKRYDQRAILTVVPQKELRRVREFGYYDGYAADKLPGCGTIGCVAGWVVALRHKRPGKVVDRLDYAQRELGLNDEDVFEELIHHNAAGFDPAGTAKHAERGAAHIARFQKKYARQLKAKKLTD